MNSRGRRGRRVGDRVRAMRFALWAQTVPAHQLTPKLIGAVMDLHETTASHWRMDWLAARGPEVIGGLPPCLNPQPAQSPREPFATPAATGQASQSHQE